MCKMKSISIIIPIYNSEEYLNRCLDSVVNQTIVDKLEVILINDGSTDTSLEIANSYLDKYNCFKLFSQENKGVSSARNKGIKEASAMYTCFLDADDEVLPNYYEILLNQILETNSDMAVTNYTKVFSDGTKKAYKKPYIGILDNKFDILKDYFTVNRICPNPVDKIYKTNLVKRIAYPEGYAIGEDKYFVYEALKQTNRISIDTSKSQYLYYINEGSAMKSEFSYKYLDSIKLSKITLSDYSVNDELYPYAEASYISEICRALNIAVQSNYKIKDDEELLSYLAILKKYKTINALKYMNKKHAVAFILMKSSPKLYAKIYNFLKIG